MDDEAPNEPAFPLEIYTALHACCGTFGLAPEFDSGHEKPSRNKRRLVLEALK